MATHHDIAKRFEDAQSALVIQASDLSLETIAAMVDSDAIDVRPQFQRRERWDLERQSALIESFLLNIPVPPVYLAEDGFGRYSVIDGKQRITSIREFMRDKLTLRGLERFEEVEGFRYSYLPPELKNALAVRPYIRAITILRQSDRETKYEVFHRLNSGGQPLNAQEIRNVIYRGPLNELLIELSENSILRDRLKIKDKRSPSYQQMVDVEYVLRFLMLRESWSSFSGSFKIAMDTFMEDNTNLDPVGLSRLSKAFTRALTACNAIWGVRAFWRPVGQSWRAQTLAGVYDAQMVAVDQLADSEVTRLMVRTNEVQARTKALFEDSDFEAAVRVATNTPSRIQYRVSEMLDMLRAVAA